VRATAHTSDDLRPAGYTDGRIAQIRQDIDRFLKLREIIRQASGETIDLKAYEADMRHLIDTYIEAAEPRKISDFGEVGMLDLIVKSGIADAINSLPAGIKGDRRAVAETIANNIRCKIIKEHLNDPAFYDKMSTLLSEILADLKAQRISYAEFLKRMAEVARNVYTGQSDDTPKKLNTPGKRALFNNLLLNLNDSTDPAAHDPRALYGTGVEGHALDLALLLDETIRRVRPNAFRGNRAKENVIKAELLPLLVPYQKNTKQKAQHFSDKELNLYEVACCSVGINTNSLSLRAATRRRWPSLVM
jgi:type I restriction enzyme R subunit